MNRSVLFWEDIPPEGTLLQLWCQSGRGFDLLNGFWRWIVHGSEFDPQQQIFSFKNWRVENSITQTTQSHLWTEASTMTSASNKLQHSETLTFLWGTKGCFDMEAKPRCAIEHTSVTRNQSTRALILARSAEIRINFCQRNSLLKEPESQWNS